MRTPRDEQHHVVVRPGGTVTYGPAGRPLPQLPLEVDTSGHLRSAGNFSARVGPSWWNVRSRPTNFKGSNPT